jgi:hypothetical protein
MDFNPVCLTKYVSSKGAAFVDDTGLGTNQPFLTQGRANSGQHTLQEASVVSNLQVLAQQWECLLFSAGGALNLSKCFWFLISWRCTGGLLTMIMKAVNPAELKLTSDFRYLQHPPPPPRQSSKLIYMIRTLGVQVTPNGACNGAMEILEGIALDYAKPVSSSHLAWDSVLVSYIQHFLPKLHYQLPALSLTKVQYQWLTSILCMALLVKNVCEPCKKL